LLGKRNGRALPVGLLVSAFAIAGCGSGGTSSAHHHSSGQTKPPEVVPGPAGLLSSGPPQPNGMVWVLAGTPRDRTVNELNLSSKAQQQAVGVSSNATAVTQSSTGLIALGLATKKTGAVELLSGSTGSVDATVPVSDPVMGLAFGDDGTTLYVLEGVAQVRAVAIVDTLTRKLERTIGLPGDAVGIVPTPSQKAIWSVQRSGVLQETSLTGNKPITAFPAGEPGIAIALSPNGKTLYVLKGTRALANIAVISTATEVQKEALPAASDSVGLGISLDGSELYDPVGTAAYGNIQIVNL
jgi:DNA-binding beta-propeller fold protein YncE